jgi:predicted nuclease of predicted toxin-antitoxin system
MSVKLLLDANLSWRLVAMLQSDFVQVIHITRAGLTEDSSDTLIWELAHSKGYTIVTNDEDFYLLAVARGFPPKIVLLRTGNQSTQYIAMVLSKHKDEINDFCTHSEYGLLEIY